MQMKKRGFICIYTLRNISRAERETAVPKTIAIRDNNNKKHVEKGATRAVAADETCDGRARSFSSFALLISRIVYCLMLFFFHNFSLSMLLRFVFFPHNFGSAVFCVYSSVYCSVILDSFFALSIYHRPCECLEVHSRLCRCMKSNEFRKVFFSGQHFLLFVFKQQFYRMESHWVGSCAKES